MKNQFHQWLKNWKPIHLCWLFDKFNWNIPLYFIGQTTSTSTTSTSTSTTSTSTTTTPADSGIRYYDGSQAYAIKAVHPAVDAIRFYDGGKVVSLPTVATGSGGVESPWRIDVGAETRAFMIYPTTSTSTTSSSTSTTSTSISTSTSTSITTSTSTTSSSTSTSTTTPPTTVEYQEGVDGYSGCNSREIFSNGADAVQSGAEEEITWWATADQRNAVIEWDLSAIPGGATITAVTISLYITDSTGTYDVVCRRILQNWVDAEVTWNSYSTGNAWGTAGCKADTDRSSTASDTTAMSAAAGWKTWSSAQLITDVQNFIDSTWSNYGWTFQREDGNSNNYVKWATKTYGTNSLRPKISITYTT